LSETESNSVLKALVTGGAGFIGSNLVSLLLRRNARVRVVDDLSTGYADNLADLDVDLVVADVCDDSVLDHAAADMDVIFHLAASVGNARAIADPVADSRTNVIGTIRVLEAARKHGVPKVVYSSSAGIFGELMTLPIREDHPQYPLSPYGVSKLAGEKMCLAYRDLYGIETVCLRYFNVYGPNQRYDAYGNVIPIFVHRMLAGEPLVVFGDGEQTRDFVAAQDVAAANLAAATAAGVWGCFNIASGTRITINRLVDLLREASEVPVEVKYAPERPGDVRHSLADLSAAQHAFGFAPAVAIEDGLREYVEWAARARQASR
jgi:UDP-glucose 4-epimerase